MKKIIIIGASSGIGKSIAQLYAKTDAKIGLVGRREDKLKELYLSNPDKYHYQSCDISNLELSSVCLEELTNKLGGLDLIIISAGTGELNPSLDFNLEEPTILTNVLGWTHLVNWAFRYFQNQGNGHIVTISSIGGLRGNDIAPAYNASKAYQINYTEGIRQKAVRSQLPIFITDIRPGFVDTRMAKGDGLFWITSLEKASKQIFCAIQKKRKIVYVSKRWKLIAQILKIIPFSVYSKIGS